MGKLVTTNKKLKDHEITKIVDHVLSFLFILLTLTCVFSLHSVPSGSMEPFIPAGSIIVCWRLPFLMVNPVPHRGAIVSFTDPDNKSRKLLKRVIGLPGDILTFSNGYVYLNGALLEEPYLPGEGITFSPEESYTVPPGHFFAMGDNRANSVDSRHKSTAFIPFGNIHARWLFTLPDMFSFFVGESNIQEGKHHS